MLLLLLIIIIVLFYAIYDVNYFTRTYFTVLTGRCFQRQYALNEVTSIYGICTFQDCDVRFKGIRLARVVRELDFARYHFYDRTGVYRRSQELSIRSLQGSTLVLAWDGVPIFTPYKINSKLVYWDERSLFFEHELVTLLDGRVRAQLVSRQYALSAAGDSLDALLSGLPGFEHRPHCPEHLRLWLSSMQVSSAKLRLQNKNIN